MSALPCTTLTLIANANFFLNTLIQCNVNVTMHYALPRIKRTYAYKNTIAAHR